MKNNLKFKGVTIIHVDSIESDSSAEVEEVLSGNKAGVKIFGFLAKAIVKTMKVLAPHFGLSISEVAPAPAVEQPEATAETKTETETKPEAEATEVRSKVKAALNPEFNYSKVFDSKANAKKKKHNEEVVDGALEELRKFKEELRKKYKL